MVSGSVPAFITYYAVLVCAFHQIPVVALGTLRVQPAAAVGLVGGQEVVGRHVLLGGGRGGADLSGQGRRRGVACSGVGGEVQAQAPSSWGIPPSSSSLVLGARAGVGRGGWRCSASFWWPGG